MPVLSMTGSHVTDDDIKTAEDKFAESLHLAQVGMFNLLENDVSLYQSPVFPLLYCMLLFLGGTDFTVSHFC